MQAEKKFDLNYKYSGYPGTPEFFRFLHNLCLLLLFIDQTHSFHVYNA